MHNTLQHLPSLPWILYVWVAACWAFYATSRVRTDNLVVRLVVFIVNLALAPLTMLWATTYHSHWRSIVREYERVLRRIAVLGDVETNGKAALFRTMADQASEALAKHRRLVKSSGTLYLEQAHRALDNCQIILHVKGKETIPCSGSVTEMTGVPTNVFAVFEWDDLKENARYSASFTEGDNVEVKFDDNKLRLVDADGEPLWFQLLDHADIHNLIDGRDAA